MPSALRKVGSVFGDNIVFLVAFVVLILVAMFDTREINPVGASGQSEAGLQNEPSDSNSR